MEASLTTMGRTEEEGRAWRQDGPVMLNVFSQPSRNVGLVVDVHIGVADKIKVRDEKFGDLHGDPQRKISQARESMQVEKRACS